MLDQKTIFKWHDDLTLTWNNKEIKLKLQQELSNNLSNQITKHIKENITYLATKVKHKCLKYEI